MPKIRKTLLLITAAILAVLLLVSCGESMAEESITYNQIPTKATGSENSSGEERHPIAKRRRKRLKAKQRQAVRRYRLKKSNCRRRRIFRRAE